MADEIEADHMPIDDQTEVDSNIEYYYTESESEQEDQKLKEQTAEELRKKHLDLFNSFVKSKTKLKSEFMGLKPQPGIRVPSWDTAHQT